MEQGKENLSFRVNHTTAEALKRAAQREYCSVAAVVRRAVAQHLEKLQQPEHEEDPYP